MSSQQATADTTIDQSSQRREPTANLDMNSEQAPVGNNVGATTPEAAGGKPTTNPGPYDDDEEFNTRVKDTEAGVVGQFQKAFSHLERPTADNTTVETSSATQGKGGTVLKNRWDDDDTIEKQLRNTTAQVAGTFKGLATAFEQAGQKIRGGVENNDSSETEKYRLHNHLLFNSILKAEIMFELSFELQVKT